MALKYLAGTLPKIGVYTLVMGTLSRLPSGSWDINAGTVSSVEMVGAGKEYNYAAGGVGIVAGAAFAGPVGAVVGGLLPNAFKDNVVQFVIRFRNGDVAHFAGSPADYQRALNASYKGHRPEAAVTTENPTEVEQLRAEVAALRAVVAPQPVHEPEPTPATREEDAPVEVTELPPTVEGSSLRIWLSAIPEPTSVPAPEGKEPRADRKRREAHNTKLQQEHLEALRSEFLDQQRVIRGSGVPFAESIRLMDELLAEYRTRTGR